jgi:STAS domain
LRVAGDVDLSSIAAWQSALAALADRADEVRLDAAGLGFIDVQGVRRWRVPPPGWPTDTA